MTEKRDDRTYAMMVKPVSSACNLRCGYCYYLGKQALLGVETAKMSPSLLETYTRELLAIHGRDAVVEFAWHGGEPLLAGLDFYREAICLQKKYGRGRTIRNTLQTNGTLLTDEFCRFFRKHDFSIGLSIDGPEALHDRFRKTADGTGSFSAVLRGAELLRAHGVPFSTLTAVNRVNAQAPLEVYGFLRELTDYMQFLPVVERGEDGVVLDCSVTPESYGAFLTDIWAEWLRRDRGARHVQIFDVVLDALRGRPSSLCVHDPVCGHSGSVEANGDVYACDRFAFPAFRLGNLADAPLGELMERNRNFGLHKTLGLPDACLACPDVRLCFGGCPKDRFENGRNYLCAGYRMLFRAVRGSGVV